MHTQLKLGVNERLSRSRASFAVRRSRFNDSIPLRNSIKRAILFSRWRRTPAIMSLPIRLISTDFDGTLHAECENPPVPHDLQQLIGELQRQGAKWVINTGRDLSSLMEGIARARLSIRPDYVVVVEREI